MQRVIKRRVDLINGTQCLSGDGGEYWIALAAKSNGRLVPGTQDKHRNRTVDILFNSVAAHARGGVIGVVLSGSLDDGSRGLAAIAHAGGTTMVLTGL
jgi:two-component system chemotaxis response regulator CheB